MSPSRMRRPNRNDKRDHRSLVPRLAARALALWRHCGGITSIEFALTAPFLVAMLVPVIDLGMGFYQQMQVSNAAEAGAEYAVNHFSPFSASAISTAVTRATTLSGISASPTPTQSCGCPSGSAVVAATCGTNCANGQAAGTYVTVTATASYTPLFRYSLFGGHASTLTSQAIVRIQ
jgi:Flp pilus assembly protein TadG